MKKMILVILAAFSVICACARNTENGIQTETQTSDSACLIYADSVSHTPNLIEPVSPSPEPTPGVAITQNPAAGDADLPGKTSAAESVRVLCDTDSVALKLHYGINPAHGTREIVVKYENKTDKEINVELNSVLLNDCFAADDCVISWIEAQSANFQTMHAWEKTLVIAGQSRLIRCSGTIRVYYTYGDMNDDSNAVLEQEFEVFFPSEGTLDILVDSFRNVNIHRQILRNDEKCRIVLLYLGMEIEHISYEEYISYLGMLYFENNTDSIVPFSIDGITINDSTIDMYVNVDVQANTAKFVEFIVDNSDLIENGIDEILSIELLLHTISDNGEYDQIYYPIDLE